MNSELTCAHRRSVRDPPPICRDFRFKTRVAASILPIVILHSSFSPSPVIIFELVSDKYKEIEIIALNVNGAIE
jgi:hypothetical protein